jgi:hypothetical protein
MTRKQAQTVIELTKDFCATQCGGWGQPSHDEFAANEDGWCVDLSRVHPFCALGKRTPTSMHYCAFVVMLIASILCDVPLHRMLLLFLSLAHTSSSLPPLARVRSVDPSWPPLCSPAHPAPPYAPCGSSSGQVRDLKQQTNLVDAFPRRVHNESVADQAAMLVMVKFDPRKSVLGS